MGSVQHETMPSGIYVPTLSFFKDDEAESVDLERCVEHNLSLAQAGVVGLVLQGSTGEAVCLTREERKSIIEATRKSLDENHFEKVVIVAGMGGQCLQESLAYARDAHAAGANYGIVLSPSYFIGQMTESALFAYFTKLADLSPLPFLIYNFPGVTNGLNLSAPFIASLSGHESIVGTKLTCNTVSKMQYLSPDGTNLKGQFHVLTGSSAFLSAAFATGICGPITGLANLFPHVLVALWDLIASGGSRKEVARLQNLVTNYEEVMTRAFIPGSRATLEILGKKGGKSRSPIPDPTEDETAYYRSLITDIAAEEKKLASKK